MKVVYEHLKENGDVPLADSAPKNDLKHGEIDIKALQQKRQHAELTRFSKFPIAICSNDIQPISKALKTDMSPVFLGVRFSQIYRLCRPN